MCLQELLFLSHFIAQYNQNTLKAQYVGLPLSASPFFLIFKEFSLIVLISILLAYITHYHRA